MDGDPDGVCVGFEDGVDDGPSEGSAVGSSVTHSPHKNGQRARRSGVLHAASIAPAPPSPISAHSEASSTSSWHPVGDSDGLLVGRNEGLAVGYSV